MPPKKSADSELSEIKQLLLSLTSDLQAVKSDLAELKKNQSQGQSLKKGTPSACASCAAANSAASSRPEKALRNIETTLAAKVSGTQTATLLRVLSKEESETDDDDETTLASKVRGPQTATLLLSKEESETDDDDENYYVDLGPWGLGRTREDATLLDLAVWDAVNGVEDALHEPGINVEWIIMAIHRLYFSSGGQEISRWEDFQNRAETEFPFCLYGVFYHGHEDPQVAAGTCFCRASHPPTFVNKAVKCIRVERCDDGKLAFHWGEHIGHRPDPGRWEC